MSLAEGDVDSVMDLGQSNRVWRVDLAPAQRRLANETLDTIAWIMNFCTTLIGLFTRTVSELYAKYCKSKRRSVRARFVHSIFYYIFYFLFKKSIDAEP